MTSLGCSTSTKASISLLNMKSNNNKKIILKPHTTMTNSYNVVLPASIGDADQVLKIASVSDNTAICEWGAGGGGGGSGIVNNRIDGDLTIGEDDSEILTIASKINIPGGAAGQVLTKGTDGLVEFDSLDNWVLGKGVPNLTYIWDGSSFSTTSSLVSMDLHDPSQANSVATSSNKIYIYWNPLTSFKITHFYVWAGYNSSNVVYNFITNCTLQGNIATTDGTWVTLGTVDNTSFFSTFVSRFPHKSLALGGLLDTIASYKRYRLEITGQTSTSTSETALVGATDSPVANQGYTTYPGLVNGSGYTNSSALIDNYIEGSGDYPTRGVTFYVGGGWDETTAPNFDIKFELDSAQVLGYIRIWAAFGTSAGGYFPSLKKFRLYGSNSAFSGNHNTSGGTLLTPTGTYAGTGGDVDYQVVPTSATWPANTDDSSSKKASDYLNKSLLFTYSNTTSYKYYYIFANSSSCYFPGTGGRLGFREISIGSTTINPLSIGHFALKGTEV